MLKRASVIAMVAGAACLGAPALAQTTNTHTAAPQDQNTGQSPNQRTADRDFGRFSQDGAKAMADIVQARLALFNGNTNDAKLDLDHAKNALQTAQNDGTVFLRAESELHPPKNGHSGMQTGANDPANTGGNAGNNNEQIKWLPVGGSLILGEDYVATAQKQAGVAKADTQLKQGNRDQAMRTLKLADVDMVFDMDVAPLQKTIDGVNKATTMLDSGQFYEANQILRGVQDGVRVDEQVYQGTPGSKQASNENNGDWKSQPPSSNQ